VPGYRRELNEWSSILSHSVSAIEHFAKEYTAAWCSGDPSQVPAHYAPHGQIAINRGDAIVGTAAILDMVAGFYAEFPDLQLFCDFVRTGGDHVIFAWTLDGHHAGTKNRVRVGGWEEWDLTDDLKVQKSLGWFDGAEYDRQIAEGYDG
jgi:hypothetical protein